MSRVIPFSLGLLSFLLLSVGGMARADTTSSEQRAAPLFTRHIQAVMSRLGCNGGTCHGAVKGQNGFKLSLFSADPALDHERLLREAGGRRLNLHEPDASLLLLKATGRTAHQGGQRMAVGSAEYQILRRWIADGAPLDQPDRSRVTRLLVHPNEHTARPGERYRLRVEATFADGSHEDVTPLCSYESLTPSVATVEQDGSITARGVGDTALLVRYRAEPALAMLLVPRPSTQTPANIKPHNFIDQHILAKLQRLSIPPVGLSDDATFLRRATLDVTGELPVPAEVRAFLADSTTDKRERKIAELLQRPGHAALWTLKFCDLLKASDFGVYADGIRQEVDAPRFQQWIRARLDENVPYDQFVERILTATSREGRDVQTWAEEVLRMEEGYAPGRKDVEMYRQRRTLDLYWQRNSSSGLPAALQVSHAFLGLRLECAQCHRHPHDVWQQDDLLSFANFFMSVRKIGFQGDNEKKFPKVAVVFKKMNDDAKKLTEQAKKLRENDFKKLEASVRKAKPKADPAAVAQLDKMKKQLADMERRSRSMSEAARRVMHSEVRLLAPGTTFATVTSPIGTQTSKRFRLLGQTEETIIAKDEDPRRLVMAWMRRPDNPYFARAIVNRVWAHYFGRGIIDPPDNLSSFNPPSHPKLLQELCRGFIENKYDLRWLHRTILTSRTYQQSSMAGEANEGDRTNYAYFYYRRLPAEVLVDALNQATGTTEKMDMEYHHWPANLKTVEIPFTPRNTFVTFMLANFGKPKRNSAVQCDCERDGNVSVLQVLSFANHPRVRAKVADAGGRAARIVKEIGDDEQRIEEIFLVTLARLPRDAERQACRKYIGQSPSPIKGVQGILWSLLNTREFVLQH
ncbi:MAG TPA: DUF1553 domain-containing protein [Gemmataceae bacterium]|nr:DUF1553 domain-containing protein [Gemmataceae bacterium]